MDDQPSGLRYTDEEIADAIIQRFLILPAIRETVARRVELPAPSVDDLRTRVIFPRYDDDDRRAREDEDQERSDREYHERGMGNTGP